MSIQNKLKVLGLAGLLAVTGCASLLGEDQPKSFYEQYGKLLILRGHEDKIEVYLDSDGDNIADFLRIYKVNNVGKDGMFYLELISIGKDKNRDGLFTEDEMVPYGSTGRKIEAKDLI